MTKQAIIKRAYELNKMLIKLGEKCSKLAEEIHEEGYDYNIHFRSLRTTLDEIYNFDLVDSIFNAEDTL